MVTWEALFRDLIDAGQKLPGPADGVSLEVVAKAEVAEHFERGEMTEVANFFDIAGTKRTLDRGHAGSRRLLFAHEVRLELLHPRAREHRRWVADGHQRPGREQLMPAILEELQERFTYLGRMFGDGVA